MALAVAVLGAGAVGRSLAWALRQAGYAIAAVISRRLESAQALAAQVGAPVASTALEDLPADVPLVFCCVPDDKLPLLAQQLAHLPRNWSTTVVAHTSGALPAHILAPLAERGASLLSFHPLQAFPKTGSLVSLQHVYVGLEGDPKAMALGYEVVHALGAYPIELTAEAKARYHLAAVLVSNGLGALLAMAGEVLATIGVSRQQSRDLLLPLLRGTLENMRASLPEEALTGPAVRGDLQPIQQHLEALKAHLPHLLPVYAALTTEMIRAGVRVGRLDPKQAALVLDMLRAALDAAQDFWL
ncbi:Rossmann-like and DUF2520 domain-containing protein [Rhodothermus bifroesti]|uniref:DUF2520 domain-containing protein n=1 Tax=Rhodothermus marinus TaxID=29549 RepID=A0A7V2B1V6_RHOMR|nr:DUF2520 domain-containing protein [Rhodothermus bifroesti]GBD00334.1 Glutamyl-tRNA reductase [bacterium HR18]